MKAGNDSTGPWWQLHSCYIATFVMLLITLTTVIRGKDLAFYFSKAKATFSVSFWEHLFIINKTSEQTHTLRHTSLKPMDQRIICDSVGFKAAKCLLYHYNGVYLTPFQTYSLIIFLEPTHSHVNICLRTLYMMERRIFM